MAEIHNLRQARKRAARVAADAKAADNRRLHGLSKAERILAAAERERRVRTLDGARLDAGEGGDPGAPVRSDPERR